MMGYDTSGFGNAIALMEASPSCTIRSSLEMDSSNMSEANSQYETYSLYAAVVFDTERC